MHTEIYLGRHQPRRTYTYLLRYRGEIEVRFGEPLGWQAQPEPDSPNARIVVFLHHTDPDDRDDWPRQHRWLVATASRMHDAFRPVIAAMPRDLSDKEPE